MIVVLQTIPEITISGSQPVALLPLLAIVAISAAKDFFEDSKRHRSDREENFRKVKVYDTRSREFGLRPWKDLLVGNIVQAYYSSCIAVNIGRLNATSRSRQI